MLRQKNDRFSILKTSSGETGITSSHSNKNSKKNSNENNINTSSNENMFKNDKGSKRFEALVSTNIHDKKNRIEDDDNSQRTVDSNSSYDQQTKQNSFLNGNKNTNINSNNDSYINYTTINPTKQTNNNVEEYPSLPWVDEKSYLTRLEIDDDIKNNILLQSTSKWSKLFTTHCDPYNENCAICYENNYESRRRIEERKEEYRYIISKYKREIEVQKQKEINEQFNKYVQRNRERLMNTFEYDYVWSEEEKREYLDGYCYYCEKHNNTYHNDDESGDVHDENDDVVIDTKKITTSDYQ